MRSVPRLALLLALAALPLRTDAEEVTTGSTLAPIALEDQHGRPGSVTAETRGLLFSRDMDGGALVREALAEDGAALLAGAGAVYVADVHAMPGPIRRFIAIPRMRERPYPVLLDTDGAPTADLPSQKGRVTWLRLEALRVEEVRFLGSRDEVRAVLGPPAGH
jgi:hypothetical protein